MFLFHVNNLNEQDNMFYLLSEKDDPPRESWTKKARIHRLWWTSGRRKNHFTKRLIMWCISLSIFFLLVFIVFPLFSHGVFRYVHFSAEHPPSLPTFSTPSLKSSESLDPPHMMLMSESHSNARQDFFVNNKEKGDYMDIQALLTNSFATDNDESNDNSLFNLDSRENPLSPHTKKSKKEEILKRDDDMCNRSAQRMFDPLTCLGPPYIYVTFHGGFDDLTRVKNICRYTRDGCGVGAVLYPSSLHTFHSLRDMLLLKNGSLIVTEAWKMNSRILLFDDCNPRLHNMRELKNIIVSGNTLTGEGLIHPYGLAKTVDDVYLFISVQGTSSILRYYLKNGYPATIPYFEFLEQQDDLKKKNMLNDGTFNLLKKEKSIKLPNNMTRLNFFQATFVSLAVSNVRGVEVDNRGNLYVANKNKGLMVFDSRGMLITTLHVKSPISVYYCLERDSVWVGSSKKHCLYEYNTTTWSLIQRISHPFIEHPAGIVSFENSLFVISQKQNKLLEFSMDAGKFKSVILDRLIDAGEHILFSNC